MSIQSSFPIVGSGVCIESEPETVRSSCAFPGICVLPSGRWLVTCRAAPKKNPTRGQHVLLSHSDDGGATWSTPAMPFPPLEIDGKPGLFRAAYLTALGGDELLATLCWVDHSDPNADFFNEETQGLLDTRIFLARSSDGGSSWSTPQIINTSPFQVPTPITGPLLLLPNGQWLLQFELNKPYLDLSEWQHSSPALSERTLFSLSRATQAQIKGSMQDAWSEMGAFSLGLPATALLPDGDILVVFYAGQQADETSIHWMKLQT